MLSVIAFSGSVAAAKYRTRYTPPSATTSHVITRECSSRWPGGRRLGSGFRVRGSGFSFWFSFAFSFSTTMPVTTRVPPSPNANTWGAYHAAEIPYVFGTLKNRPWPFTQTDFDLSNRMSSYWTNFAIAGDPNGAGLPKWTPYDGSAEPYMELGDTVQLKNHLLKAQLDALESIQQQRRPTTQQ